MPPPQKTTTAQAAPKAAQVMVHRVPVDDPVEAVPEAEIAAAKADLNEHG